MNAATMIRCPRRALLAALLCTIGSVGVSPLWSQSVADPNDQLYVLLALWEEKGYYPPLPAVRPYPLQLVQAALEDVIEAGSSQDARIASRYATHLAPRLLPVAGSVGVSARSKIPSNGGGDAASGVKIPLEVSSTGTISPILTYSVLGRMFVDGNLGADLFPLWDDGYETSLAIEGPPAGVDIQSIFSLPISTYGVVSGGVGLGTDRWYAQAGLLRTSFGPVKSSVVLGPQAPQAGHFSVTYRADRATFSLLFMELVAKLGVDDAGDVYSLKGGLTTFPGKYLVLHSADVQPLPWLQIGLFHTVLFGERISPLYLLPVPLYTQAYIGDYDNSLIGVRGQVRLPFDIVLRSLLYVDDLDLSEIQRLSYFTNGNKLALDVELSWQAPLPIINRFSVRYQAITPFMYTHTHLTPIDYLQYTHHGVGLGSSLPPNSERARASAYLFPTDWLQVELWLQQSRHGNGSDYGTGTIEGDGSIFDDGYVAGEAFFLEKWSFLTQSDLESTLQVGACASATIDWQPVTAELGLEYVVESVRNRNLDPSSPEELNHLLDIELSVSI